MDKSVFLYWWFSFDLQYYLILGGTNKVLHTSVKKFLCALWSLALAKKFCSSINNSRTQVFGLRYFLWLWFQQPCSQESFCVNCNIPGHSSTPRECPKHIEKKSPNKPWSFSNSKLLPLTHPVMTCGNIKWKITMMESSWKKLTTATAQL